MTRKIRWGILGTGSIAKKFAEGLKSVKTAELVAVGSRQQATADQFANQFGAPRRHASYEALAADTGVDAIYVATPHAMHRDATVLCLEAGRAVLCEKPFAINEAQARTMVETARRKKVFLMEAMWTRFLPLMVRLRDLLSSGAIGEVRLVQADFGFRANVNPKSRLFDPALGGGALLDVGVYNVSLASMVLGAEPTDLVAQAELGSTGVDEQLGCVLKYPRGQLAVLSTAIRTTTPMEATIIGTEGYVRLHSMWWRGSRMTVHTKGDDLIDLPFEGNGYNYEAEEVGRCLREGRLESDIAPLDESLAVMRTLDRIRAKVGLKYPMEK